MPGVESLKTTSNAMKCFEEGFKKSEQSKNGISYNSSLIVKSFLFFKRVLIINTTNSMKSLAVIELERRI